MNEKRSNRSNRRKFLATSSSLAASSLLAQDGTQNRKRIYIAADDHTDYMWTGDEQQYRKAFLKMLDHYLDLADQTDSQPPDYQSRWNCDGLLWFREFQQNRGESQVDRLVRRIKSGHISIPMTVLVSCYGGAPTEAVLRGLYYGGHVERKYDLRLRIAVSMENQTLPYGLGMLWAGSGVRYSWKGICACASKVKAPGTREHDVYWWVGPDGSRILMKWYSLAPKLKNGSYANEGPGGYAEARNARLAIEYVDKDATFRQRNPHDVIGLFGQGWDDLTTIVPLSDQHRSFPAVAKAATNDTRRVIVSNENDYFDDIEKTHGHELPQVQAAFGNEWEIYSASLAEVSASVKRATEKLRAAEAMASVVACLQEDFGVHLREARDQAWIAYGLYWEHDWTADGPVSRERRAAWQRKIAKQIVDYVDALHDLAKERLGQLIVTEQSNVYFVFNPLGWKRTNVAEIELAGDGDFEAIDVAQSRSVESQVVTRDGKRYLQFLASDVPAVGYKSFRLVARSSKPAASSVAFANDGLINTRHHSLRLRTDGTLGDWTSKRLSKQLVGPTQVVNRIAGGAGQWSVESRGPVSTTFRIEISEPVARTTRVTLYEHSDRIDIENQITQNFGDTLAWRFDFQLDNPATYHEEVGAILDAAFQSSGGDYDDHRSRTDWLTLNHFAAIHDQQAVVTLSASDCQFFHLGEDVTKPMDSRSSSIHALAGGQVDGPKLGIQNQGGDRRFLQRFSLVADEFHGQQSRRDSMKAALEHQNPFVVGAVNAKRAALPADQFSLLAMESDDVIVWSAKPSEDGVANGIMVRLWNLAVDPSEYALSLRIPDVSGTVSAMKSCVVTTHVETDDHPVEVRNGSVYDQLSRGAIRTIRCLR